LHWFAGVPAPESQFAGIHRFVAQFAATILPGAHVADVPNDEQSESPVHGNVHIPQTHESVVPHSPSVLHERSQFVLPECDSTRLAQFDATASATTEHAP